MRSVLITGASGGIGRAAARLFAGQGYAVAVHCHRSRDSAEALVQELQASGSNAILVEEMCIRDRHTAFHSAIIVDRGTALRLGKRWMTKTDKIGKN